MNTNTIGRTLQRVGSMLSSNRSNSTRSNSTRSNSTRPTGTARGRATGTRGGGGGLKSMARRFLKR